MVNINGIERIDNDILDVRITEQIFDKAIAKKLFNEFFALFIVGELVQCLALHKSIVPRCPVELINHMTDDLFLLFFILQEIDFTYDLIKDFRLNFCFDLFHDTAFLYRKNGGE